MKSGSRELCSRYGEFGVPYFDLTAAAEDKASQLLIAVTPSNLASSQA
jgi:hypothetical protein